MIAHIGLGSNLGEREAHLLAALEGLAAMPRSRVLRTSSFYDTEPVGDVEQPAFLNAVAELETELEPHQLLWNLQLIERRLGRVKTRHWGPRTIDLDLLLCEDRIVDDAQLRVPHPEMIRRAFVLVPLTELDPDRVHPETGETLAAHLRRLEARPRVRKTSGPRT